MSQSRHADLVVVGSGAGGLAAALTAATHGLHVVVLEKTPWFGGTTALSEGMIWVPGGPGARERGIADDVARALDYLDAAVPGAAHCPRARAYCANAAAMLAFIEAQTAVRYELASASLDYYDALPGAAIGVRAYRPRVMDGRELPRALFAALRPPLATTVAFRGMMLSGVDYAHVLAMRRSAASAAHVARLGLRYARDRLRGYPRGTRLANGNALVAGLLQALQARGVALHARAAVTELLIERGAVHGVRATLAGEAVVVRAHRGVVLATGGFPGNRDLQRRYFAHCAHGVPHLSLAPATNTGDGLALADQAGARRVERLANPAAWTPASNVPQADGSFVPFPHYVDRAKPGIIVVDAHGRRFCNEAAPYVRFVPELVNAAMRTRAGHVWLVCDHAALRRYGLGAVPPAPGRVSRWIARGYLLRAHTLERLAAAIGAPPRELERTVAEHGADAARGVDSRFGRGAARFDRAYGDANHRPNPCLGPLATPPYYAMKLYAGDIGTFVGVDVDGAARVLDRTGAAIPGLYAAGNDVASPTGGDYPAAGVTVGAALTFGWLAGRTAAGLAPTATREDACHRDMNGHLGPHFVGCGAGSAKDA